MVTKHLLFPEAIEKCSGWEPEPGTIKSIKRNSYKVLNINIGGDAPKNFIRYYEYEKDSDVKKNKIKTWPKYIAKVGHKWYPNESICEFLLNRIGEVLELEMAKSKLRTVNGQVRFLSRYFLDLKKQLLVHGAEIYSGYLGDKIFVEQIESEKLSRELLTFQFTKDALIYIFKDESKLILNDLVKMLIFDAITGNNDRHFYNWGVIKDLRGNISPRLSPIYDSARGLFWNQDEKNLDNFLQKGSLKLENYINNSKPKIGIEGNKDVNHFGLVERLYKEPDYIPIIDSLINENKLKAILYLIDNEFGYMMSNKRLNLIKKCLHIRFDKLLKIIKKDNND